MNNAAYRLGIGREFTNADWAIINCFNLATLPAAAYVYLGLLHGTTTAHWCIAGIRVKWVDDLLSVYNFRWVAETPIAQ
jgi:hypothetical protein